MEAVGFRPTEIRLFYHQSDQCLRNFFVTFEMLSKVMGKINNVTKCLFRRRSTGFTHLSVQDFEQVNAGWLVYFVYGLNTGIHMPLPVNTQFFIFAEAEFFLF